MTKRQILVLVACVATLGIIIAVCLYLSKEDSSSDHTSPEGSIIRVGSTTTEGIDYCVEGRLMDDKPDELFIENCGKAPVRVRIQSGKARYFKPGASRSLKLKQPTEDTKVDILTAKRAKTGMGMTFAAR